MLHHDPWGRMVSVCVYRQSNDASALPTHAAPPWRFWDLGWESRSSRWRNVTILVCISIWQRMEYHWNGSSLGRHLYGLVRRQQWIDCALWSTLSGSLLVDSQPLGRLPSDYEKHGSYGRLFGQSTIKVIPANAIGLQFSARIKYYGYNIQFGLAAALNSSATDLLVQAKNVSSGNVFELLPPRLFQGQVPTSFLNDFVHWYDYSTGDVDFRPVGDPWAISSPAEWRLVKGDDSKWRLKQPKNEKFLVAVGNPTACAVARILFPLAKPPFIHLILRANLSTLEIEIPSLRVGFMLDQGSANLRSREYPGMRVSEDQSLGTLNGFHNKLLLSHQRTGGHKVFLLEGRTSCQRHIQGLDYQSESLHDHVDISVNQESSCRIHQFDVDRQLGRLVDNDSMHSKLILVYLHGYTSFRMPDRLTRRTGTEEALSILRSAALKSFGRLRQETIDILARIANELTPKRVFCPEHERVMQSVQWSSPAEFRILARRFLLDCTINTRSREEIRRTIFPD